MSTAQRTREQTLCFITAVGRDQPTLSARLSGDQPGERRSTYNA